MKEVKKVLLIFTLAVMTLLLQWNNFVSAQEKQNPTLKDKQISMGELEELKSLFAKMEAKIIETQNKLASIHNPSKEIQDAMSTLSGYHDSLKAVSAVLNKAFEEIEELKRNKKIKTESVSIFISKKEYEMIDLTRSLTIKIYNIIDAYLQKLKKDYPEI